VKRVIDICCGVSEITKEFHILGKPEYCLGVEIVIENAEIEKQYFSQEMVGSIKEFNADTWTQLTNYDLWVFEEVLEHLYEPWKILKNVSSILPHDGQIAYYVPNLQHWSIQARLSIDDKRYAYKGLRDRTNILFLNGVEIDFILSS